MNTLVSSLRTLALSGAALLLLTAAPDRARAAFTLTFSQVGNNVVVDGSGTINTTALSTLYTFNNSSFVMSADGYAFFGPTSQTSLVAYGGNVTGPNAFGTNSSTLYADSGTGNMVGFLGDTILCGMFLTYNLNVGIVL